MNKFYFFTYVTLSLMCHNLMFSQNSNSAESLQNLRLSAFFADANSDNVQNVSPNISAQSINGISDLDYVTVEVDKFTVEELVTKVLNNTTCLSVNDFSSTESCGFGYFNRNNSDFPFNEGIVISSGKAENAGGKYSPNKGGVDYYVCSGIGDDELQAINTKNGNPKDILDASSVKFDFVAVGDKFSFRYLFASDEYGQYQCGYSDAFAFILTDVTSGFENTPSKNLAVIPGTATSTSDGVPVSVTTIRKKENKPGDLCGDSYPEFFGQFNESPAANVAASDINFKGQTVVLTASADVIPTHTYTVRMVIGDYSDNSLDSAVFIEAGSFEVGSLGKKMSDCSGNPSALSVSKFDLENVVLFPNPANDKVQIQLQNSNEVIDTVLIHDLLGNLVQKGSGLSVNQHSISVGALPKGLYLVQIITKNKLKVTKKLMVN